jgi:hypothetical protein
VSREFGRGSSPVRPEAPKGLTQSRWASVEGTYSVFAEVIS